MDKSTKEICQFCKRSTKCENCLAAAQAGCEAANRIIQAVRENRYDN